MRQKACKYQLNRPWLYAVFSLAFSTFGLVQSASCHASTPYSVTIDGVSRPYFVYLPKSYSPDHKAPVVFVLHPLTKDAAWAERVMGWDPCADKNGFIVVYGQSAAARGVWNAELTPNERRVGLNDVGYLKAVMNAVEGAYAADLSRIYMVGFSAGAIMTAKMGATVPKSLTAVATVEGITGLADKDVLVPATPLSAIMFRGTADAIVPYTSDTPSVLFHKLLYSAAGSASDWARADGCSSTPTTSQIESGHIIATDYKGGFDGSEVELMTINGGRHEYRPDDTDLIWQFFSAQTKATDKP